MPYAASTKTPEFAAYYSRLSEKNIAPLWEVLKNLVTTEPVTPVLPAHWRYQEVRPLLFEAGRLISAEQAERRVLVLENPGLRHLSSITHSLYAGVQLVLPGEVAPQHRHSQAALRFILEGKGATTTVEGERLEMYPGDLILTPSWQWHDHQNETMEPIVWLDGLDIALVALLDAGFAQHSNRKEQEVTREKGTSRTLYGTNMLPIDDAPVSLNSPLMRYPYAEARAALERLKTATEWDACHGIRMRYAHPRTGDWVMPTMGRRSSWCQKISPPRIIARQMVRFSPSQRGAEPQRSATRVSRLRRMMSSSVRPGCGAVSRQRMTLCCLLFPIARCRKSWDCGARNAARRTDRWTA